MVNEENFELSLIKLFTFILDISVQPKIFELRSTRSDKYKFINSMQTSEN